MSGVFNIRNAVRMEIEDSFDIEDMRLLGFDRFWDAVDVQNTYEEEWEEWKAKNIKEIYREIYHELTKENTSEN